MPQVMILEKRTYAHVFTESLLMDSAAFWDPGLAFAMLNFSYWRFFPSVFKVRIDSGP